MSRASRPSAETIVCHVRGRRTTAHPLISSSMHLHPAPMSSAIAVAEDPRRLSMSFIMRNLSIPIPRPIAWAVSTFMARLRRIDEATAFDHNTDSQYAQGMVAGPQRPPFQQTPVPWTFLTSGYFIGFLIFVCSIALGHWQA